MRKRILSMLLALAMVASLLPMTALAAVADDVLGASVYFRDVQVSVNGSGADNLVWTNTLENVGSITLPAAKSIESYPFSDKTAPQQFTNYANTGELKTYIVTVDDEELAEWIGDRAIAEKVQYLNEETDLNKYPITNGQYLIVQYKVQSEEGDVISLRHYIAKINVTNTADVGVVKGDTATIKGKKIGGKDAYCSENQNPEKVDLRNLKNTALKFSYDEATDTTKLETKIDVVANSAGKGKDSSIKVVMTNNLTDSSEENVKKAFDEALTAGDELSGTKALKIGPEGGKVWVIAKITSENGEKSAYYVWLAIVSPAPAPLKMTGIEVDAKQDGYTLDKAVSFKGNKNLAGGDSPEDPEVLTVTLPSKVWNKTDKKYDKVTINNLNVTLSTNENGVDIFYGNHLAAAGVEESSYKGAGQGKTGEKVAKKYSFSENFSGAKAVYLKVTAPVMEEDLTNPGTLKPVNPAQSVSKYYKLVVVQEVDSDDASIHGGYVIGSSDALKGAITGEMSKVGTGTDFAELTAVVPYTEPAKWEAYESSKVELTVDLDAQVEYIVTKSRYDDLDDTDFSAPIAKVAPGKNDNKKGITTVTIPRGFNAHKQRIYIRVTAPDGVTKSIYVLDNITMAEKGSEAKLIEVVLTQNDKELTDYAVQFGEESGTKDDPISVTAIIPFGSKDANLAAKLTASYGATIWSRGEKVETVKVTAGEVIYNKDNPIMVTSGDKAERTYYTLDIKMAELADKNAEDSIVLDLQDGTLTVDPSVTVADVKNGLLYGGALQVLDADEEIVADTDKVATGYVAKVGTTDLDIIVRGDVNEDGACGLADALLALKSTRGSVTLDALQAAAADVDGNAEVTLADALKILKSVRA